MAFALYMGIGKRRNELHKVGDNSTRDVLKYYNVALLDKYMTIVTTLGIVFYALWAGTVIDNNGKLVIACGDNSALELITVQPEGSKVMLASQMLCGTKIPLGTKIN